MCIIAVSEEAFTGGQELAKTLAESLGLRYVDSMVLVEQAAACGGDRQKLRDAFDSPPTFRDRFTRHRQNQLLLLQAALAEEIRDGNAVCFGIAADLLTLETKQILRIGLHGSHTFRRLQAQERLGFRNGQAERYLNECDRSRRRWLLYLFDTRIVLPMACDLVMNLEQLNLYDACTRVSELIRDQSRFTMVDPAPIENFAVSTRIKAALAQNPETAHLDMHVEIHDNTATLHGIVRSSEEIDAVKRAAPPIPANMNIDFSQMQLGGWDYAPPFFSSSSAKPHLTKKPVSSSPVLFRPAWLVPAVAAMVLLALAGSWVRGRWFRPPGTRLISVAGVITDSRCGTSHAGFQPTADCVRSCVKRSGARYILNDGTRNFVLSDQRVGEKFAAQRVVATGFLDEITGDLRLGSIQAVAR